MAWQRGMRLTGQSKIVYTLTEPLYPRLTSGTKAHIWQATGSAGKPVAVKFRKQDMPLHQSDFQKEVSRGRDLTDARYIRRLLDVIREPTETGADRGIVLEWFPETLWEIRDTGRLASLGLRGTRKIMRDVLEGIRELHAEGVIHLDIKAQNILVDGTSAKLSDLGSSWPASPPSTGIAQPMPYRSPEILFGLQWSKAADIWGWGMVYLHMIQAYLRPEIWGLYDRLPEESTLDKSESYEERVRVDIFHDFRLDAMPYYQQCKDRWPDWDVDREDVTIRSILQYLQLPEEDIRLLENVLIPDPNLRPTAEDILSGGWIDG